MSHTIAIRIDDPLLRRVRRSARVQKKSRSEVIRGALEDYFERAGLGAEKDPYSVLLSLMPFEGSGVSDLASRSKFYLKRKCRARTGSH